MRIKEVIAALELFAPLPLQESYDNAGLQVGLTGVEEASGALLCLDVTEEVLAEAVELGANLVVAHHPLLFRGLKRLSETTQVERCVRFAVKHDITIYAAHTNLDNVQGGVNATISDKLGLTDTAFLRPMPSGAGGSGMIGSLAKPESAEDVLRRIKAEFGVECLMHNALLTRPIRRVAVCGGSGAFLLGDAIAAGADLFLTGEMGYHEYFGHEGLIQIAVIGHYQSEKFTMNLFKNILGDACPQLPVHITRCCTNPISYL